MEKALTPRQKELLLVIYKSTRDSGYPPTLEEMRENLGVASNQSILDLLDKLIQQKLIKRQEGMARSITVLPRGRQALNLPPLVEVAGMATAGIPMEAVELTGEWQSLPSLKGEEMKRLNAEVFLVQVSGDSMINAGINDGDAVLVQRQKEFSSGDIVLAEINNEVTVKRFISDDKPPYAYLKPENPNYQNICFTEDTRMQGKIIALLRKGRMVSVK